MGRSKTTTVEVHLGYHKQGDDLAHFLEKFKSPEEAIIENANNLRSVAEHLDKIAIMISGHNVNVRGDTHYISIECSHKLAKDLIRAELAEKPYRE